MAALTEEVRSLAGEMIGEGQVVHVYTFEGDLVARMDVEDEV